LGLKNYILNYFVEPEDYFPKSNLAKENPVFKEILSQLQTHKTFNHVVLIFKNTLSLNFTLQAVLVPVFHSCP